MGDGESLFAKEWKRVSARKQRAGDFTLFSQMQKRIVKERTEKEFASD
jgi:hypothetical protein